MRYPTRPERLAAEREKKRAESTTASAQLNPPFPYRALAWQPTTFSARRVLPQSLNS